MWRTLLLCQLSFLLLACTEANQVVFSGQTMGTTYSIKVVVAEDQIDKPRIKTQIEQLFERINARMSTYRADSEISRFNEAPRNEWFPVSPALVYLVNQANSLHALSGGAFDITVGASVNMWGFGPSGRHSSMPSEAAVKASMDVVGQEMLQWRESPPALRKSANLYLDLSAIGKGYAVDLVADFLIEKGLLRHLVEVGGEIRVLGNNMQDKPWRIAIERPDTATRGVVWRDFSLTNGGAVATSGDYRNFIEHEGVRYSHMIDARTGMPAQGDLASVTVLAERAAWADGLVTMLNVLGADAGFVLAEREKIAALFIIRQGQGYSERATSWFLQSNGVSPE